MSAGTFTPPKTFHTAYPGSMFESADGPYVRRDDPASLAAALLECIAWRDRELEELRAALHSASEGRA